MELNPVRGGIVASPEEYPWSSAKSHVTGFSDPVLSGRCFLMETMKDWRQYLGEENDPDAQKKVIEATNNGHPCGEDVFVRQMEVVIGRRFIPLPAGRPRGSIKVEEKLGADGGRAEAAENPLFSDI